MCQFFSAILTRDGDVRFCEDNSHERILTRLGWPDDRPLDTRGWVRVECVPPHEAVRVDETSVPAWYDEDRPRYDGLVLDVAGRVAEAKAAYEAIQQPALAAYQAIQQPAYAAYQAIQQPAYAAYQAIQQPALAAYQAKLSSLTGYVGAR
jgi:hypothetical protein